MSRDKVTLEQLDRVLGQLGFSRRIAPPNWIWYEHRASDTVLVIADRKLSEAVRQPDWVSARIHLLEKGLVSEEQLHEMLWPNAPASLTPTGKRKRR